MRDHRWVLVLAVLLGLGGVVAWQVNEALGVSVLDVNVPVEQLTAAPPRPVSPPPAIAAIAVPDDVPVRKAAGAVVAAYEARQAPRSCSVATPRRCCGSNPNRPRATASTGPPTG